MRYLCTNCSYIYDEDKWEIEDNIPAWTKFDILWDYYECWSCWWLADLFQEIKEEVNYLREIPFDALEAEHFINLEYLWDDNIRISVWKWESHSYWSDHRIWSIGIYDEYWDLVYEKFYLEDEEPVLEFNVSDLDDFEIKARCTIHWVWAIKVER